jgi:hypothetical protein
MSWYRRFKNRKIGPGYEINGKDIENLIQEYFKENELNYSRRWVDYRFDNTVLRVMRRTPYEFALDETHTLFATLTSLPNYYIELDYIRQEVNWLHDLVKDSDIINTLDWFLESPRSVYFFIKYYHLFVKEVLSSNIFREGNIISGFPCDPKFGEFYYQDLDISKVIIGSEKRAKMWTNKFGMSKHRIFGHQWAVVKDHKFEPLIHPRFRSRVKTKGKYDI